MLLPDWLQAQEVYAPRSEREAFIDRSILSFLGVLTLARPREGARESGVRVEPLVKIVAGFIVILLLSLTRSTVFLTLTAIGLLVLLAGQSGERIAAVIRTSLIAGSFTMLTLLPSALFGHASSVVMITSKVLISAATVKLIAETSEWASLSGAFKRLGVPDLCLLVLDITLSYITLLGEFALAMLYALRLRSVGRNDSKAASLSGIAGSLFLKSKEMAEEMYAAMECRCFTGEYRVSSQLRLGLREFSLGTAVSLLSLAFFFLRA
jgi:cobalt/nickel transport system permease protein